MANTYYIDSVAGDNSDGLTWAKAYTSFWNIPSTTLGNGDIVYVASRHVDADPGAAKTMTGPSTTGQFAKVISVTWNTTTYAAGGQIKTTGGAYDLTFNGGFALYGVTLAAGQNVALTSASGKPIHAENCTFKCGDQDYIHLGSGGGGRSRYINCTYDFSADTANSTVSLFQTRGYMLEVIGGSIVLNATYPRTNCTLFWVEGGTAGGFISGIDFSGIGGTPNLTRVGSNPANYFHITNCKFPSSYALGAPNSPSVTLFTNCNAADAPYDSIHVTHWGEAVTKPLIYRTGGASIDSQSFSWLITTTSYTNESHYYTSPWLYGEVTSTGTKNFDVYFVHDSVSPISSAMDNSQIWLEVEYLSTADSPLWASASNHRTITATAAAHTTDSTSTWNGTGPSFTNKRMMRVTATIGEAGQYRARVCVAVASITGSAYLHIDPKVTVS